MKETWVQSLVWEHLLEKEMATHFSILAWKIPWGRQWTGIYDMAWSVFFPRAVLRRCPQSSTGVGSEELTPEMGHRDNSSYSGQQSGHPCYCPASNLVLFSCVALMIHIHGAAQVALAVKSCHCRRCKRHGLIPGLRRSPGVGNGNPLQYSCLENSIDGDG